MPQNLHPARKKFTRFASKLPFQFGLPNVSAKLAQSSDGSPAYLTSATSLLRQQILPKAAQTRILSDGFTPNVLMRDAWATTEFSGKRVLFLIPADAIGDCVGMALFIRALMQKFPDCEMAVFNSASASDIFATVPGLGIYPLIISTRQLERYDYLLDLSEMEGWKNIATMPVNTEEALCEAFGIAPIAMAERTAIALRPKMAVGILPMASSPLRTLPPRFVRAIARHFADAQCDVTLVLNAYQGVMRKYRDAIGSFDAANVRIVDGFKTIGDLVDMIGKQHYVVMADSGPAHITKLFQTPGMAVYTSAPGDILQGRFNNLGRWQSPYEGAFCKAPCGLAKLRATSDGKIGCMGSLGLPIGALDGLPKRSDPALAERLTVEAPVPCVGALDQHIESFLADIRRDTGIPA